MTDIPLITIGITCFNAEKTIEAAVRSALVQDWPNFEIIVVDDCSSDQSLNILRKLAQEYQNKIKIIVNSINKGCAASRNILIKETQGEFLVFFDDDDISEPERLRLQYNSIITYEGINKISLVLCYTSAYRIYPNGYIMNVEAVGSKRKNPVGYVMSDFLLFNERLPEVFYGGGTPTCALMARTSVFRDFAGFDENLRRQEDVDFAIRVALQNAHFIGIQEKTLRQNVTDGNEKSAKVELESFLLLTEKNKEYLIKKGVFEYIRLWSKMRYFHFSKQDVKAFQILLSLILFYPVRTIRHFGTSAIRRFFHERRMNAVNYES